MMDLSALRQQIDALDADILQLFTRRAQLAQQVGRWKQAQGDAVFYRPERERQVLERLAALNQNAVLPDAEVKRLFRELMSACLALEKPLQIAYLGPEGTFTHLATLKQFGGSVQAQPQSSIEEVFAAVHQGRCDYGLVPVENSQEGAVHRSLDCLLHYDLQLCGEIYLRIEHHLLSQNPDLNAIERLYAHPQALAQCRSWLRLHLPRAEQLACNSNAEGVQKALQEHHAAAIGSEWAAAHYALPIQRRHLEDSSHNTTRFVVLGRQEALPSGEDKTSLLLATHNRAGALLDVLQPLQDYGVNMSKIESRPSQEAPWEYVFFIDVEGHQRTENLQQALQALQQRARRFRILGSYPRAVL